MELNYEKDSKERIPYEHYLEKYQQMDPLEMSQRCKVDYEEEKKVFHIRLMGYKYLVSWPEFQIEKEESEREGAFLLLDLPAAKIMVLRFLTEGQCIKGTGKYLTYREVPSGELYFRQFEGRCLMRLKFSFGFKLEKFAEHMESLGATKLEAGDVSYEYEFINHYHMRIILWAGDDEFPPSSQILFEDNFACGFQAEDLAVAGDISISTLKALG